MGFWFWFLVFASITVAALVGYALIGLSLAKKAKGLQAPGERLQTLAAALEESRQAEVLLPDLVAALDTDPSQVMARRKSVLRANKRRKEQRQRRLIERLRTMKIDESRFR